MAHHHTPKLILRRIIFNTALDTKCTPTAHQNNLRSAICGTAGIFKRQGLNVCILFVIYRSQCVDLQECEKNKTVLPWWHRDKLTQGKYLTIHVQVSFGTGEHLCYFLSKASRSSPVCGVYEESLGQSEQGRREETG